MEEGGREGGMADGGWKDEELEGWRDGGMENGEWRDGGWKDEEMEGWRMDNGGWMMEE